MKFQLAATLRRNRLLRRAVLTVRRWRTAVIERHLGISTEGPLVGRAWSSAQGDATIYEPIDYPLLYRCVDALQPGPDDIVHDIGCGMGRILCVIARRPVGRCIGIDLSPELIEIARRNAQTLRGRKSPIEVRVEDAAHADYSGGTAFVLFNPFGAATLRAVLERITATALPTHDGRKLRLLYVNPFHETEMVRAGWEKTREVRSLTHATWGTMWQLTRPRRHGETADSRIHA